MKRRAWVLIGIMSVGLVMAARAADEPKLPSDGTKPPEFNKDTAMLQKEIDARKFRDLQAALLRLAHRLESSSKPEDKERAANIKKALAISSESGIENKFDQLKERLKNDKKLTDPAEILNIAKENKLLVDDLRAMINELLKDDRAAVLAREKQRLGDLLKELDKVIRSQKQLRALTDRRAKDGTVLGKEQGDLANKTNDIAKAVGKDGGKASDKAGSGKEGGKGKDDGKDKEGGKGKDGAGNGKDDPKAGKDKEGGGKDGGKDGKEGGKGKEGGDKGGKDGQGKEGGKDGKEGQGKDGGKDGKEGGKDAGKGKEGGDKGGKDGGKGKEGGKDSKNPGKDSGKGKEAGKDGAKPGKGGQGKGEGKPGKGGKGEGKGGGKPSQGAGKPGKGGGKPSQGGGKPGQPGQPGQGGGKGGGDDKPKKDKPDTDEDQAKKQIEDANKYQNQAKDELDRDNFEKAKNDETKALEELEKARKKLEDILKQLREEEIERLLAALQQRCEKMLQMQIQVYQGTVAVDDNIRKNPDKKATRGDEQKAIDWSKVEGQIVEEANKAIQLLEAEGSAVAFPEVFVQVRDDMRTVERRLGKADVGDVTQVIELDIIATLKDMIEALKKAQEEQKAKKEKPPEGDPPKGKPQDQKLIDLIAELKMIRAMQVRVNTRTKVYGDKFDGEQVPADKPDIAKEIENLSERQQKIFKITKDIAEGKTDLTKGKN